MFVTTNQKNKYRATVTQEDNVVNVQVGNIENKERVPGVILDYGVRSVNGMSGDVVLDIPGLSGAVLYSQEQELSEEEQQTARTNIGLNSVIPTKTSDLENDSGFITESDIPVQSVNGQTGNVEIEVPTATSQLINDSGFLTNADIPTKVSDLQNDAGYIDATQAANAAPVQSVNGQTGNVSIAVPEKVSDLQNDSGFITGINSSDVTTALGYTPYNSSNPSNYVNASQAAAAAPVQSVNGQTGTVNITIPTVPTNVSAFNNDANYITSAEAPVQSVNGQTGTVTGLQTTNNLVTSVSSLSTDSQYPSAKLFYDTVGNIETLLAAI